MWIKFRIFVLLAPGWSQFKRIKKGTVTNIVFFEDLIRFLPKSDSACRRWCHEGHQLMREDVEFTEKPDTAAFRLRHRH